MRMKFNVASVILITSVVLIAQFIVPEPYDWMQNTISELAAQGYRNKWIMQLDFIGFGGLLMIDTLQNVRRSGKLWFREFALLVYGLAILLSGIFCTHPFIKGVPYSEVEARLHSAFAMIAGFALSITLLLFAFTDEEIPRKLIHVTVLAVIITLSIIFGIASSNVGIVQRIMYAVGFTWLILIYNSSWPTSRRNIKNV